MLVERLSTSGLAGRAMKGECQRDIRILFVGESWQGSSARSLREALAELPSVKLCEVSEDRYLPTYLSVPLRVANRLLYRWQRRELETAVQDGISAFMPDVVVVYKGRGLTSSFISSIKARGMSIVNVFPDLSPHSHGWQLREALNEYDLVISTKHFHPMMWRSFYGYHNRCVFVPHGYDPSIHYWPDHAKSYQCDVALCASWRWEYHELMAAFAKALGGDAKRVSVVVAGANWSSRRRSFPLHWQFVGLRTGRSYAECLRAARVAIAPVNRQLFVNGVQYPGDEDTTRTYELAAAHCFFLHQRTLYIKEVFDEMGEVPLWDGPAELADLVRRWLPDEAGRREMARRAHARAVPAYAIPTRAMSVLKHLNELVATTARGTAPGGVA